MTKRSGSSGPLQRYLQDLQQGLIVADESQLRAAQALEDVYLQLCRRWEKPAGGWSTLLARLSGSRVELVRGLYFWGGVGRGKTYLMDLFFHALPGERKMRMHFHRFMLMVHKQLHEVGGIKDPLQHVATKIAQNADVLCFDEFFVSDIGDAMLLGNLLDALFDCGVTLVATSNVVPGRLYENGLQRQMFLPAIALLEKHTQVVNIDGGTDYRLQSFDRMPVYHYPHSEIAEAAMLKVFTELTRGMRVDLSCDLEIEGRRIHALRRAQGVVWFSFDQLCRGARGAADYIELARQYHAILVSGVPVFTGSNDDEARRFVTMIDEFYDHRIKLVLSAEGAVEELYRGSELSFAFARTASRLLEMQTREYLAMAHLVD